MQEYKFVALGDSITYGYPFTPQESWVEILRQRTGLADVKEIAAGLYAVALKYDGIVEQWGYTGSSGSIVPEGLSSVQDIAVGYAFTVALKTDGSIVVWGDDEYGQCSNAPTGLTGIKAIAAGENHVLALKEDGTVVSWGDNRNGQCDIPVGLTEVKSIAAGGFCSMALTNDEFVVAWGSNYSYQCDVPIFLQPTPVASQILTSWSAKSNMTTSRSGASVAEVDGKIYVIGGQFTDSYEFTNIVEEFDPVTDTWTQKEGMPTVRAGVGAMVINEKIYAIGGMNESGSLKTVEVFDPAGGPDGLWETKPEMPSALAGYSVPTVVLNGKLYALGENLIEYDPVANTCTDKGVMPQFNMGSTSQAVNDKIYVLGLDPNLGKGDTATETLLKEYDPSTSSWVDKIPMPSVRSGFEMVEVNGKIFVLGGETHTAGEDWRDRDTVELYNPASDSWTVLESMPTARHGFITVVVSGKIYAMGGMSNYQNITTVEEYAVHPGESSIAGGGPMLFI
ncbi:MAG: hypothetical protein CVU87_09770 [Firmicutes bacterium HGW-Firmicutes-12]|nr:MAG: hypothetical protein CVU87_09770 [Firmicutes bacterium HGW-Firmicutes-12]